MAEVLARLARYGAISSRSKSEERTMMNVWPEMSWPPFHMARKALDEEEEEEEEGKRAGWVDEVRGLRLWQ